MKYSSVIRSYRPPVWLYNGHLQTIIPSIFRKIKDINYLRERVKTPDQDFIDIDWLDSGAKKLIIITHGLEGDSQRPYVKGMARAFHHHQHCDVLAWNFRGCSGEMNTLLRFYHSGDTKDLQFIVNHALAKKRYEEIVLIGFSLGGNVTLKYLGEHRDTLPPEISAAITFSVPLHLQSSSNKISQRSNFIYSSRFIRHLKRKVKAKSLHMPDELTMDHFSKIKTLQDFDDFYTAPLHGFKDASSYYEESSSLQYLEKIRVPTLIVNALNDPFLGPECFPVTELRDHPYIYLKTPAEGGHCGFPEYNTMGLYWSEKVALEFATKWSK